MEEYITYHEILGDYKETLFQLYVSGIIHIAQGGKRILNDMEIEKRLGKKYFDLISFRDDLYLFG